MYTIAHSICCLHACCCASGATVPLQPSLGGRPVRVRHASDNAGAGQRERPGHHRRWLRDQALGDQLAPDTATLQWAAGHLP
jgi:hypothetical protein